MLLVKNKYFVASKCNRYVFILFGDQYVKFKCPLKVLTPIEAEISLKSYAHSNFRGKTVKNYKSLGRDLKKVFLLYKKYFSMVSGDSGNFINRGLIDFFDISILTSPLFVLSFFFYFPCKVNANWTTK